MRVDPAGVEAAAVSVVLVDETLAAGTLSAGFEHPQAIKSGARMSKFFFIIRLRWGELRSLANAVFLWTTGWGVRTQL